MYISLIAWLPMAIYHYPSMAVLKTDEMYLYIHIIAIYLQMTQKFNYGTSLPDTSYGRGSTPYCGWK